MRSIPAIPKGSSRSVIYIAPDGAKPGTYQVTSWPVGGARGSGQQVTIEVKPKGHFIHRGSGIGGSAERDREVRLNGIGKLR